MNVLLLDGARVGFTEDFYGNYWTFLQNNALIHTARTTKEYFSSRNMPLLEWPATCSDLSPIEDVWAILSNKVYKSGRQLDSIKHNKKALIAEWEQISPETLKNLFNTMRSRLNQLIMLKEKQTSSYILRN